jgi:1-acyl-sn-glycerol-3-phosphate acyltransferase
MLSAGASTILAICVLAGLGLSLAGWVVMKLRTSPFSPVQSVIYALVYLVARILWRASVPARFPIPPNQGAVIICNHRSSLDPSFIALTVPRVVHWLVAREYCEFPLFRGLLRLCGSIPTNRGGIDTAATKAAIRIVEEGGLVGLFPEGRINMTAQTLLPGHPGAAMIALKARAPVVPCYIRGAPYDDTALGCLLMPASVQLVIGEPIDLSPYFDRAGDRELLDELTLRFLKTIAQLAGDENFQPSLAGRHSRALPVS